MNVGIGKVEPRSFLTSWKIVEYYRVTPQIPHLLPSAEMIAQTNPVLLPESIVSLCKS